MRVVVERRYDLWFIPKKRLDHQQGKLVGLEQIFRWIDENQKEHKSSAINQSIHPSINQSDSADFAIIHDRTLQKKCTSFLRFVLVWGIVHSRQRLRSVPELIQQLFPLLSDVVQLRRRRRRRRLGRRLIRRRRRRRRDGRRAERVGAPESRGGGVGGGGGQLDQERQGQAARR